MHLHSTGIWPLALIALSLFSLAAKAQDFRGWTLSPPVPEENVYVDMDAWTLTPPDGRPPTSLRAAVAERVKNGSLSPESAYLGRAAGATKEAPVDGGGPLANRGPASPSNGLSLDADNPDSSPDDPAPDAPPAQQAGAPASAAPPAWDPDGTSRPYYDYEKTKLACEKAQRVTQPTLTTEMIRTKQSLPWDMPEGNLVPSCKDADLAEMMKREAYNICSTAEALRWGHKDQKNAKAAWVSPQQIWSTPQGDVGVAHGMLTCNSGSSYEVFMKLGEYNNECWICGMNGSLNRNPADVAWKKSKLKDVDITKGPRTSPHEAEFPEIPGYWKQ